MIFKYLTVENIRNKDLLNKTLQVSLLFITEMKLSKLVKTSVYLLFWLKAWRRVFFMITEYELVSPLNSIDHLQSRVMWLNMHGLTHVSYKLQTLINNYMKDIWRMEICTMQVPYSETNFSRGIYSQFYLKTRTNYNFLLCLGLHLLLYLFCY